MLRAAAFALAVCFIAAGCGGSSSSSPATKEEPAAGSLEALWRAPGADVAIVPGTSDFSPGRVRLSFLVVDGQGRLVPRPKARVWLAHGLGEKPFAETTATLEKIGVEGRPVEDAPEIFVTHLDLPKPGKYWILAEPIGGRKVQALGNVVVKAATDAPDIGAKAIPSKTPTIASTGGNLKALTTAKPPDKELLQISVADALAAKVPFVVSFATPLYCTTRTCGPVVDVVDDVRKRYEKRGVRFIHVEIYKNNDPAQGTNKWVQEWNLPSEPFTFLVGADGKIKERFEGTVSVGELADAVAQKLL